MNSKIETLLQEIGAYGVQCSETKELAPSQSLVNAIDAVKDALRQADQQAQPVASGIRSMYWPANGYGEVTSPSAQPARELVCQLMMKHGFATGHADTLEDALKEFDWQLADRAIRPAAGMVLVPVETIDEACEAMELAGMHSDSAYRNLKEVIAASQKEQGK